MSTPLLSPATAIRTLDSMPAELLEMVATNLSARDLLRFRLVCHATEAGSLRVFAKGCFESRCFGFNEHSLHILDLISLDKKLRPAVCNITIKKRLAPHVRSCELCRRACGPDRESCSNVDHVDAWTKQEMKTAQSTIQCLTRLPSLSSIRIESLITSDASAQHRNNMTSWQDPPDAWPVTDLRQNARFLISMLSAVADKKIVLKALAAFDVQLDGTCRWPDYRDQIFASITCFDISVVAPGYCDTARSSQGLPRLLQRMPNLTALRIRVQTYPAAYNRPKRSPEWCPIRMLYSFRVMRVVATTVQLCNLRIVELNEVALLVETLVQFLHLSMPHLECLRLGDVIFDDDPAPPSMLAALITFLRSLAQDCPTLKLLHLADISLAERPLHFPRCISSPFQYARLDIDSAMIDALAASGLADTWLRLDGRNNIVTGLLQLCGEA